MQIKNNLKFFCIPLSFEHPQILEMYTTPPHTHQMYQHIKKSFGYNATKMLRLQFVFVRMF